MQKLLVLPMIPNYIQRYFMLMIMTYCSWISIVYLPRQTPNIMVFRSEIFKYLSFSTNVFISINYVNVYVVPIYCY